MSENEAEPSQKTQAPVAAARDVSPVVLGTIKPEIVEAILKSQASVNALVLGKNDRNKFDGYDYVSVDQFYMRVNPIINENGLTFKPVILNRQMMTPELMLMEVRIDLLFRDGTVVVGYSTFPLVHPMTSPQHTGAALSYAAKIFLRTAFMVATGEADSDALPTGRVPTKPQEETKVEAKPDKGLEPDNSANEVQSLHPLERDFLQKAHNARTVSYMETWRENNLVKINRLRDSKSEKDRAVYVRLKKRYETVVRGLKKGTVPKTAAKRSNNRAVNGQAASR